MIEEVVIEEVVIEETPQAVEAKNRAFLFNELKEQVEKGGGRINANGNGNGNGAGGEEMFTLRETLGMPEPLTDVWPSAWAEHYVYLPPKIRQYEAILPILDKTRNLYNEGDILGSVQAGVQVVKMLVRSLRTDTKTGETVLVEVDDDEIKDMLDPEELAAVLDFMMNKQGIRLEEKKGSMPSQTGARCFVRSAATTPDTD